MVVNQWLMVDNPNFNASLIWPWCLHVLQMLQKHNLIGRGNQSEIKKNVNHSKLVT